MSNQTMKIIDWSARILAAVIMLQTLFFKFTGAEESVYIFSQLGAEPVGRIGVGVLELIASVLLLTPRYVWLGAILGIGLMAGAIMGHLTVLGIDVMGDGGYLFFLAVVVLICSATTLIIHRMQIPFIYKKFA